MALGLFHPLVETWFDQRFPSPTEAQTRGWPEINAGEHTLIMAPTGSGKTLTAFLAGIDRLVRRGISGELHAGVQMIYVSPLKALGADIERNLQRPLRELAALAQASGEYLPTIRTAVRSGDSSAGERAKIIRRPPHILITTPESLYLMLTAKAGRQVLRSAETVIVDEIHALFGNKRGAHLALSLQRLDALCGRPCQRIGLSATVEPPTAAAEFLVGHGATKQVRPYRLIDAGRKQALDVAIEIPRETLGAVATRQAWNDIYERIVTLIGEHRTTLIFVPSRRLCERVAHDLDEKLTAVFGPKQIAAHHGALAKTTRRSVEERLQSGTLRAVVATASLELGIDIGDVELVCQIGSPRSLAVLRQRVGRACHTVGGKPKGRMFALTRDDLIECAAAVRAMCGGKIDKPVVRAAPLDILAQQMVAEIAAQDDGLAVAELRQLVAAAEPYAALTDAQFDAVINMLGDGIATRRGRSGAHLHLDRINEKARGRRGARLAALTSGGAIPDKADFTVVEDTSEAVVGTLDEDFAIESMAGDIFLLGSTSWRVKRIEAGRVRVDNADGLPPTIPFWNGEGLARSVELSAEVAQLREEIWARASDRESCIAWLSEQCFLDVAGATACVDYISEAGQALGAIPTCQTVVAERFFDDSGGMQLIIHAPFGARINRGWGMALRKKFCRTFDFELQAAATDDALLLSLGPQHSFPLDSIFGFLHALTLRETLVQAVLQSPLWETRWRWNVTRALAVLRQTSGKRTPPQLLRMRAADLAAAVFPEQAGCQDNHGGGDLELPDHPLVDETINDCLHEAIDLDGLTQVVAAIKDGRIKCLARDTIAASPFAHGILAANPYAFLDDAPLEERRTRAVSTARPGELLARDGDLLTLDPVAIRQVLDELAPDPRDPEELHDLLCSTVLQAPKAEWRGWFESLEQAGRATCMERDGRERQWVATERVALVQSLFADARFSPPVHFAVEVDASRATAQVIIGFLQIAGPHSAQALATALGLPVLEVEVGLAQLEADGQVLRGQFTPAARVPGASLQWCERRILQRIHRLTLGQLREQIRPVAPAELIRFLLRWQHVAPGTQLHGSAGLLKIIEQLQGLELIPAAWERDIFPSRIADYRPEMLDELCFSGEVAWGRLRSTAPIASEVEAEQQCGRGSAGKLGVFIREDGGWLLDRSAGGPADWPYLSDLARRIAAQLAAGGAAFASDIAMAVQAPLAATEAALWELVRSGAVTADGFAGLRGLLQPAAKSGANSRQRPLSGRWSLLSRTAPSAPSEGLFGDGSPLDQARLYLRRYGVVCRALLTRETAAPPWRDLVQVYRRLEARGEIRGGRFVSGLSGEQFALPAAVEALRGLRRDPENAEWVTVAATCPLNLVGILTGGAKVPAVLGLSVQYCNGVPVSSTRQLGGAVKKLTPNPPDLAHAP